MSTRTSTVRRRSDVPERLAREAPFSAAAARRTLVRLVLRAVLGTGLLTGHGVVIGHAETSSANPPLGAAGASTSVAAAWLDIPMSPADRRHLLARTGFGVSAADYLALDGLTRRAGVQQVIDGLQHEPTRPMPAFTRRALPAYFARGNFDAPERRRFDRARDGELAELREWWVAQMLDGESPQTERLVLLWHDLVPTNYESTERASLAMARQNALYRASHDGRWADLLSALLRDAALLDYLDADRNRRDAPNENLGREFLELFTLGEGEYSEQDVREASRALTGLSVSDTHDLTFRLQGWHHDEGEKELFGERGAFGADALVDRVLAQPAAARHLANVYWHAFVSDAEPDPVTLEALAHSFRAANHDLGVLYRSVLESRAFWADEHRATLVKSPVDLLTGLARTLEYPKRQWQRLAALQGDLGLSLFAPPNVGGWSEGEAFVTPGRLLARFAAVDSLLDGAGLDGVASPAAIMTGDDPGMRMSDVPADSLTDASVASNAMGASTLSMTGSPLDGGASALGLRIASEAYEGPAEIVVSLRVGERTLWSSELLALPGGHDTERFGRATNQTALPWQDLQIAAPTDAIANADALRVQFVNDAAGAHGDRNVFVHRATLGGVSLLASDGVQVSRCAPDSPADAGDLHCSGHVTMARPAMAPLPADTPNRAAAAYLRWAEHRADGRATATLVLDDVTVPGSAFDHVQFRVVAEPGEVPELHIDSFDCLPACLRQWPECARWDRHNPGLRAMTVSLDAERRRTDECIASLRTVDRAWLGALAGAVPTLLEELVSSSAPLVERHRDALERLHADVIAHVGDVASTVFAIDARFASSFIEVPPTAQLRPRVGTLDELVDALLPIGLDPVTLLWPGVAFDGAIPANASATARLDQVLSHPGFQLK